MTRGMIVGAVIAALSATVAGCGGSDSNPSGTLVQSWTIEGSQDQTKCVAHGADQMRVIVYNEKGDVTATQFASCDSFNVQIGLPVGTYRGSATFLTTSGAAVSDTLPITAFSIADGQTLRQVIDFPTAALRLP